MLLDSGGHECGPTAKRTLVNKFRIRAESMSNYMDSGNEVELWNNQLLTKSYYCVHTLHCILSLDFCYHPYILIQQPGLDKTKVDQLLTLIENRYGKKF